MFHVVQEVTASLLERIEREVPVSRCSGGLKMSSVYSRSHLTPKDEQNNILSFFFHVFRGSTLVGSMSQGSEKQTAQRELKI